MYWMRSSSAVLNEYGTPSVSNGSAVIVGCVLVFQAVPVSVAPRKLR